MKQGTFNKIFKVGTLIIKISKDHSSITKEISKMGSGDIKKYEKDINKTGVDTSKVYLHLKLREKDLIIQKYIDGLTLQDFFEKDDLSNSLKLKVFKELILLYNKTKSNENLCLDWNLKNFIIHENKIFYIDYVPALYKDRIKNIHHDRLEQYKQSYLDRQIQLAGIISYAIVPFFKEDKKELSKIFYNMLNIIKDILNIDLTNIENINHVYIKKIIIINNYLNSQQEYNSFIEEYKSISMEKTAVKKHVLIKKDGDK